MLESLGSMSTRHSRGLAGKPRSLSCWKQQEGPACRQHKISKKWGQKMCDDCVDNVDSNQPISLKVPGNDRKSRGDLGRNYFNVLVPANCFFFANCGEEEKKKTEK